MQRTSPLIAILLTLATFAPSPLTVEVCEINKTPNFTQVIIRRWHRLGAVNGHRVTEWWMAKEPITVQRAGGVWMVQSEGREFFARSLRRTETIGDPEVADRKIVHECDREPYGLNK
jgi:hypothetical protein